MKTLGQLCDQERRIYNLLAETTRQAIKKADPATDGNQCLANNWGNQEARKHLEQHHNRSSLIFKLMRKYYSKSFAIQYPDHITSKKGIPAYQ